MTSVVDLTIAAAGRLIVERKLSPVELTDAYLERIERLDPILDSFVTVTAERARRDARAAEQAIMSGMIAGAMHGIPFSLKDIFNTAGVLTTAMSRTLANNVPETDAVCLKKLAAAGAILLGKNATHEFAHGGPSWDVLRPPARNPWNRDFSPSGSSSGSAAAVAAGFVPASLGTDTGGSIRQPAAACGIVGLKPTYGLVSRRGVIPNCFTHDHVGPLTWTVEDAAIVLQYIAGHDPADPASAEVPIPFYRSALGEELGGVTIGVPWRWLENETKLSAAARACFEAALRVFQDLGAKIREVTLPSLEMFNDVKRVIAISELFTIHAENLRSRPELLGASLRYRIIAGGLVRAEEYIQAVRIRTDLARAMQTVMKTIDVLALPTSEPAGPLEPVPPETLFTELNYTVPFNVTGNPALSMCSGFAHDGMPFSLQLVGRLFEEARLLSTAHAYEKATPWRGRRPSIPSLATMASSLRPDT